MNFSLKGKKEDSSSSAASKDPAQKKTSFLSKEISFKRKPKEASSSFASPKDPAQKKSFLSKEISFKRKLKEAPASLPNPSPNTSKLLSASKPLIGIDTGSKQVKFAIGKCKGNRVSVREVFGNGIPEKCCYDGKILRSEEVQASMINALRDHKVTIKDAVCSIESTEIIQRELIVPKVSDSEALGLIAYEIGQYLPIDISSYVLQYKKIGEMTTENGTQMRLMVCAMPKSLAKEYMETLQKISIRPVALDTGTNVLEKLVRLEAANDPAYASKNLMFIDMGHTHFNISFLNAGNYTFNKIIDTGGYLIDDVISKNLNLTSMDAERVKIHNFSRISSVELYKAYRDTYNIFTDTGSEEMILKETVGIMEEWLKEIEDIFKYYTSRDASNFIDEIFIYGGSSYINDIDTLLANRLKTPVKRIADLRCLDISPNVNQQEVALYLNAIGALIRA